MFILKIKIIFKPECLNMTLYSNQQTEKCLEQYLSLMLVPRLNFPIRGKLIENKMQPNHLKASPLLLRKLFAHLFD